MDDRSTSTGKAECWRDFTCVRRWAGKSRGWISSFVDSLSSSPDIVSVVVMGSAIRERGHRRSDLDLLVLYRGKRPSFKAPLEVDIRAYPVAGIKDKIRRGHEILCWAIKFGILLYDPEQFWESLRATWINRLPFPSASEASARGHASLLKSQEMLRSGDESAAEDLILAALTQFVRAKLIERGIFPASRPELPSQLRSISVDEPLAQLLEDAMYGDRDVSELIDKTQGLVERAPTST